MMKWVVIIDNRTPKKHEKHTIEIIQTTNTILWQNHVYLQNNRNNQKHHLTNQVENNFKSNGSPIWMESNNWLKINAHEIHCINILKLKI